MRLVLSLSTGNHCQVTLKRVQHDKNKKMFGESSACLKKGFGSTGICDSPFLTPSP